MGTLPSSFRVRMYILVAVLAGLFALPAMASAACTLPNTPVGAGHTFNEFINPSDAQTKRGNFGPELNGKFIQIPFSVPAGTTGLRIRYCYDEAAGNPPAINNTTLDLGVYEPNAAQPGNFAMPQLRSWGGSSAKLIGIGVNGYTSPATYGTTNTTRKAYVPGRTTRASLPGPIPQGTWAVELGAGYIDPALTAGADWEVEVTPSSDPNWSNDPFVPNPYVPYVANPNAGWYDGDVHVHGEAEPGNALMKDTFDLGFGASGLDFVTLVDHNTDVARRTLGDYDEDYPGKLILPGEEVTTYDGHFNSLNSDQFVDFRLSDIFRFDDANTNDTLDGGELTPVRGPQDPSGRFAQIQAAGGMAQINHPEIFSSPESAPACRGCAWSYSDARTDYSKVNSIELQTGTAAFPYSAPIAVNPFIEDTIAFYEHALATGNHIAAVGSSDDHKAGGANGPFDAPIGHAATAVYAGELSQDGITNAVNAGHTYVKFFGTAGPEIEMKAGEPGKAALTAIPGDSVTAPSMNIQVNVKKAGPTATRPGPYTLEILKDGVPVSSATVTSDDFNHNFTATATGRYSFKLTRTTTGVVYVEDYSTPVWFTQKDAPVQTCATDVSLCPSNKFSFGKVKLNKKKGTAALQVKVPGAGKVALVGSRTVKGQTKSAKKKSTVVLTIKAKGKAAKALKKKGKAKVMAKVRFTPTGGKAATKSKTIKLKKRK